MRALFLLPLLATVSLAFVKATPKVITGTTTLAFTTPKPTLKAVTKFQTTPSTSTTTTTASTTSTSTSTTTTTATTMTFNNATEEVRVPKCNCNQTQTCRESIISEVSPCFDECHYHLEVLGKSDSNFLECFTDKNIQGFTNAEMCLLAEVGDLCTNSTETEYMVQPDYTPYTNFHYRNQSAQKLYTNFEKKAHKTFQTFQSFYHCAKHCVHKKMLECLINVEECVVELPKLDTFMESMNNCAKNHKLVHLNLWNSCRCLIEKKKLTQLTGQCAVLVNPYYVNKF